MNAKIATEYSNLVGRDFRIEVAKSFEALLAKAKELSHVRILTLNKEGATEFLHGLQSWQVQGGDADEHTSDILSIDEQLKIIEDNRQSMCDALASSDAAKHQAVHCVRTFTETPSLPIQLIIADKGGNSGKECCLAFMVGSEAYRLGKKNEGIVGAHYTEDSAVVSMYRNLAEVLISQTSVSIVWPPLDISSKSHSPRL